MLSSTCLSSPRPSASRIAISCRPARGADRWTCAKGKPCVAFAVSRPEGWLFVGDGDHRLVQQVGNCHGPVTIWACAAAKSPSTNAPTAANDSWVNNAARPAAPSPAGSASAAHAQIVTGPWQFPTCWTRRWSPSPTNSQPSGRLTAKATHGLPFAQVQRSAPRAGRHEMAIRDADGRGELKQVEDNILLSADAYPPARAVFPGWCCPQARGPGGSPERGSRSRRRFRYTLANFVSRHSSQGSLPGADLSTNTGRDNATGPLPHSSPPHPEDAPGSPKNCRRGGDFHLAKNGDRKLAIDNSSQALPGHLRGGGRPTRPTSTACRRPRHHRLRNAPEGRRTTSS